MSRVRSCTYPYPNRKKYGSDCLTFRGSLSTPFRKLGEYSSSSTVFVKRQNCGKRRYGRLYAYLLSRCQNRMTSGFRNGVLIGVRGLYSHNLSGYCTRKSHKRAIEAFQNLQSRKMQTFPRDPSGQTSDPCVRPSTNINWKCRFGRNDDTLKPVTVSFPFFLPPL